MSRRQFQLRVTRDGFAMSATGPFPPNSCRDAAIRDRQRSANSGSDTCSRIVSVSQNVVLCDISGMALLSHLRRTHDGHGETYAQDLWRASLARVPRDLARR